MLIKYGPLTWGAAVGPQSNSSNPALSSDPTGMTLFTHEAEKSSKRSCPFKLILSENSGLVGIPQLIVQLSDCFSLPKVLKGAY